MQKVEGSSPFIRSLGVPCKSAGFSSLPRARVARGRGFFHARFQIRSGNPRRTALAAEDRAGLGERAPQHLLEDLDRALSHVEDLLVDGERELRVGMAEQV